MAGAFYPLPFQKGAMEAEVLFYHRCRSTQIFSNKKSKLLGVRLHPVPSPREGFSGLSPPNKAPRPPNEI